MVTSVWQALGDVAEALMWIGVAGVMYVVAATFLGLIFLRSVVNARLSRRWFCTVFALAALSFLAVLLQVFSGGSRRSASATTTFADEESRADVGGGPTAPALPVLAASLFTSGRMVLRLSYYALLVATTVVSPMLVAYVGQMHVLPILRPFRKARLLLAAAMVLTTWVGVSMVFQPCSAAPATSVERLLLEDDEAGPIFTTAADPLSPTTALPNAAAEGPGKIEEGGEIDRTKEATTRPWCSGGVLDRLSATATAVGVCLVALLGGYATVTTPLGYLLPVLWRRNGAMAVKYADDLGRRQQHLINVWMERRRALFLARDGQRRRQMGLSVAPYSSTTSGSGGLHRAVGAGGGRGTGGGAASPPSSSTETIWGKLKSTVTGGGRGGSATAEQVASQADGYSQLSLGVFLQAQEAEDMRRIAASGRSVSGLLFAVWGAILSVYAVTKLSMTFVNLLFGRFSTVDAVTRAVGLLLAADEVMTGAAGAAAPPQSTSSKAGGGAAMLLVVGRLSFLVHAVVVVSAIRGFFITIFRLTTTTTTSSTGAASSSAPATPAAPSTSVSAEKQTTTLSPWWLDDERGPAMTLLLLTEAMGLYFFAMLVMFRLGLPAHSLARRDLLHVVGVGVPIRYFHRLHDLVFLASATVTAIARRYLGDGSENMTDD